MHALLEGVVQAHFREILQLSEEFRTKPEQVFDLQLDLEQLNDLKALGIKAQTKPGTLKNSVRNIVKQLTERIDDVTTWRCALLKKFGNYSKPSLYFVAHQLDLLQGQPEYSKCTRMVLISLLLDWVSLYFFIFNHNLITNAAIEHTPSKAG
jgi:hypothetical protein